MTNSFLNILFEGKRPNDNVLIWIKDKSKGGTSYWFRNLMEAETFAVAQANKFDVYYGIGLASRTYGRRQRVKSDDVTGLSCLWIEVDYKTGSTAIHKKEERLPTKQEALTLINEIPFRPSLIVHSGNGFHVYWLLNDVWQFADVAERERAKRLVERWQRHFKALAEKHGWTNDSTFDLARVYRVAGTKNHKTPKPKMVEIIEENEERYTVEQIEGFLNSLPEAEQSSARCAEEKSQIKHLAVEGGVLALDPNADIHTNKFEMLCEIEPKFKLTWEKKRNDLNDQSPSSYDMALANHSALAGWDAQEITNLIIAFRRKHGHDLKLRHDYYAMTIAKARKVAQGSGLNNGYPSSYFGNNSKSQSIPSPELDAKALYGLAGIIVRTISPHTEAHPAALLIQLLVAFGNCIGRKAYFTVEATRHYLVMFAVLVGLSSKGRKGTSWDHISNLFQSVEEQWSRDCVQNGLSSGEGLIWAVRDPIEKQEPIKEKGRVTGYQMVIVDMGVTDKRLLVMESEFALVLRVVSREGNILSPLIRQAWDKGDLRSMTKNSPARATGAHISIIGHITKDELRNNLDEVEIANGFANRFLWVSVERTQLLPEGSNISSSLLNPLISSLYAALIHARDTSEMRRDDDARELWHRIYRELSIEHPTRLLNAVTSRAEAQVMRIACLYALLDSSNVVRRVHLEAANALWRYCENSVRVIFGDATGSKIGDTILVALREAAEDGLTKTELSGLLGRNASARRLNDALAALSATGLARSVREPSEGGRPTERWFAEAMQAQPINEINERNEIREILE
jgi:hypothetical protein